MSNDYPQQKIGTAKRKLFIASFVVAIIVSTSGIIFFFLSFDIKITRKNEWHLDETAKNTAKICRDIACDEPGIIDFKTNNASPFTITNDILKGMIWGGELGWIVLSPATGGVRFADRETGLLTGSAWSDKAGFINFAVTGQKVAIDPQTGEINGWAWANGEYGGWIKFDCDDPDACVRTTWGEKTKAPKIQTVQTGQTEKKEFKIDLEKFRNVYENTKNKAGVKWSIVRDKFRNIFDEIGETSLSTYNMVQKSGANIWRAIIEFKQNIYKVTLEKSQGVSKHSFISMQAFINFLQIESKIATREIANLAGGLASDAKIVLKTQAEKLLQAVAHTRELYDMARSSSEYMQNKMIALMGQNRNIAKTLISNANTAYTWLTESLETASGYPDQKKTPD